MRSAIVALLLSAAVALAAESPAPAPVEKTAVEKMDPKVKAERTAKVAAAFASKKLEFETFLRVHFRDTIITSEVTAAGELLRAELWKAHTEMRWIKGELTPAGTEAAVAAAQSAVAGIVQNSHTPRKQSRLNRLKPKALKRSMAE